MEIFNADTNFISWFIYTSILCGVWRKMGQIISIGTTLVLIAETLLKK